MGNKKNRNPARKRKFTGNKYTRCVSKNNIDEHMDISTASETKLKSDFTTKDVPESEVKNVIFDLQILNDVISSLCCPVCFSSGLTFVQDSIFGLAFNMNLRCGNCKFSNSFCTSSKVNKMHSINVAFVFGLRLIGKGHSSAKKLCSAVNINTLSKTAFRYIEKKIEVVTSDIANKTMNEAAFEIRKNRTDDIVQCGVSVDGTWQRRGYSSLNGCVAAISVDSGNVLDIEIMSKACRFCKKGNTELQNPTHKCNKHTGSSGAMEPVGVYRIFERSSQLRKLMYVDFYGDGDSKGYEAVKDVYGENSVTKFECIGHIQKRVGSRLRKLKGKQKGLGGRGKLTDAYIDKLQNYYGIAIRSNINDLLGMQKAVIAAFFHCCSNSKQPMHGQCPVGPDSWCKFQKAAFSGKKYKENSKGLPKSVMNIIKPTYMKLCDQNLLSKCLHGKTQNANESFNGILWKFIPKEIFVELQTLRLGAYMAVIQFNKGFRGLLDVFHALHIHPGAYLSRGFAELDENRIRESRRHSSASVKIARKKNRLFKKGKMAKAEKDEGISYKCGEF